MRFVFTVFFLFLDLFQGRGVANYGKGSICIERVWVEAVFLKNQVWIVLAEMLLQNQQKWNLPCGKETNIIPT